MTMILDDLRYPVGRFTPAAEWAPGVRNDAIGEIAALPGRLRAAVKELDDYQLDTPYRPGGWTVRQVVHHVADSHLNAFLRIKLALTEETPAITPYDENAFATLADVRLPVGISLDLLDALHARWIAVYAGMGEDQFARAFFHPGLGQTFTLGLQAQLYSWHSRHHVAHITALRQRQGW